MANNFGEIAFSAEVLKMQEKMGSRATYAKVQNATQQNGLSSDEIDFISQRDSFYLASNGASGFPYIQHRGGPKGFLKALNPNQLGFVDFNGNMQYISTGNLASNQKVCLFLMDYPARTRLKIYAIAKVLDLNENEGLLNVLQMPNYKAKAERLMVFDIEAFDWNCPQHINPRYTLQDLQPAMLAHQKQIEELQAEVKLLKTKLTAY